MTYSINFSTNASQAIRDIERINRSIGDLGRLGSNIPLTLNTTSLVRSFRETFRQLDAEIGRLQNRLSRFNIGSGAFTGAANALGRVEGRRERGQMMADVPRLRGQAQAFNVGSSVRQSKELQALQIQASQVAPNTQQWVGFQRQIATINNELSRSQELARTIQLRESLGAFSPGSLSQLETRLQLLNQTARNISPNTPEWASYQQQISQVNRELQQSQQRAQDIQLRNDLGAFAPGSLAQLETRLTILKNTARQISPNTSEWKEFNNQIQSTEKAIQKINKKPLGTSQRLGAAGGAFLYGGGMGGGLGSAVGGIAGGLMGGVPGAFTGAAVGQFADNMGQQVAAIAKLVAEVNKSKIALAGVSTSFADYYKSVDAATAISDRFLIPISDGVRQFTKLKASVLGAGFSTDTAITAFEGIAAAIVATGGSTEDMNGALLATSQVFSKGKVSAEELRGQIGERLAGAFTTFAKSIAKTPQELDDLLGKGQVSLKDFIKFVEDLGKKYGKTADILATAPENAGLRLEVALQKAMITYGGFFQQTGAGFQNYAASLLNFVTNNKDAIGATIAEFVVFGQDLYTVFSTVINAIAPLFESFFSYIFENFAKGMNALARLAQESQAAAGAPEKRAAAAVDALYAGRPLEGHFGGRVQAYNEALNVERQSDKKVASRTSRLKDFQKNLFKDFKPTKAMIGGGVQGNGALADLTGGGKTGRGRKKTELQDYTTDYVQQLQRQLQAREISIDNDSSLSARERELLKADEQFKAGYAINKARYEAALADQDKFKVEMRAKRLEDLKKQLADENKIVNNTYQGVLEGPFVGIMDEQINSSKELSSQIESVRKGREQLSITEQVELAIGKQLEFMDATKVAQLQPLIKYIRELTAERQGLIATYQQEQAMLQLRNQLALAQAIDPTEELRLNLQQTQPDLNPEQINQQVEITKQIENANRLKEAYRGVAGAIGDSFAQAFKGVVSGSMTAQQALAGMFQSIADSFLDMVAQMIAAWLKAMVIKGFMSIISAVIPGFGAAASGGGLSNLDAPASINNPLGNLGNVGGAYANGGIAVGGFRAFASGGVVSGPTLGLVGEGRYNEAVIPLPDGKSVPVDLGGASGGNQITSNIVVNVNSDGQSQSQQSGNGNAELGKKIEGAVKQVIVGELRPGGLLAGRR